ncbi:hypothetical protein [Nocardioides bruguierae]|uniref:Uncharacterized protein n=1 Tax=Nocardioides bruguierae TaxID=2945102 RepID=A0A9X2DAX0_9ACTN|nr:hypothetical protein [Nocardioides bruguierae]MCM0622488.1 hypothetical protein [Nocardioides bruguierae]
MSAEASIFSDAALDKQARAAELRARGERVPASLLLGIEGPRTQPTAGERCCRCGIDARPAYGGDGHFCEIHVGRECVIGEDCDCPTTTEPEEGTA